MDTGALTSLIVMVALSLIALICAIALIKVCFFDPKKVARMFKRIAPTYGFSLLNNDSAAQKNLNDLISYTYKGRTKLGKYTVNILSALGKEDDSRKTYLSDINVINYSHQNQSYSLMTNLFVNYDLDIPACLYIRRKLPNVYENLLSTVEGECISPENAITSFGNRYVVKTPDLSMLRYFTSEIQEYIMNQYDRYPFVEIQGAATTISTGRDVFICNKGISVNGPRTWNECDIKELTTFATELAKIIEAEVKKVNSKADEGKAEEEENLAEEEKVEEREVHRAGAG